MHQEWVAMHMWRVGYSTNHRYDFCQPLILSAKILDRKGIHVEGNYILHELTPSHFPSSSDNAGLAP